MSDYRIDPFAHLDAEDCEVVTARSLYDNALRIAAEARTEFIARDAETRRQRATTTTTPPRAA